MHPRHCADSIVTLLPVICEPFYAVMIQRFLNLFVLPLAGLLAASGSLHAEATATAPDFKQVYELLRANLPNATDAELNSAAVAGLLQQLHGRATLVGGTTETTLSAGAAEPVTSAVLESNVAYLRVGEVESGLADKMNAVYRALATTNQVAGVALDLRFADGNDYAAAIAVADLFTAKKTTLLEWGKGVEASPPAGGLIPGPLVVLVNGETGGAAEALAAALREADAGLIIGSPTAGLAMMTRDFPLKNGERLRIAMNPVKLGNGVAISHVSPDIAVTVSPNDERAYLQNPYTTLAPNNIPPTIATNDFLPFVDHTSEADLVQQKLKDGDDEGASVPAHGKAQAKPVIQDPVLARAVDLIKGLAIVHESRL